MHIDLICSCLFILSFALISVDILSKPTNIALLSEYIAPLKMWCHISVYFSAQGQIYGLYFFLTFIISIIYKRFFF